MGRKPDGWPKEFPRFPRFPRNWAGSSQWRSALILIRGQEKPKSTAGRASAVRGYVTRCRRCRAPRGTASTSGRAVKVPWNWIRSRISLGLYVDPTCNLALPCIYSYKIEWYCGTCTHCRAGGSVAIILKHRFPIPGLSINKKEPREGVVGILNDVDDGSVARSLSEGKVDGQPAH